MTCANAYGKLPTRKAHSNNIARLRKQFPALPPDTEIDIAPGYIGPVENFLFRVMRAIDKNQISFAEIYQDVGGKLHAWVDARKALTPGRASAVDFAVRELPQACSAVCRICGATLDPALRDPLDKTAYCPEHVDAGERGLLFADDVLVPRRQDIAESGVRNGPDGFGDEASEDDDEPRYDGGFDWDAEMASMVQLFEPEALNALDTYARSRGDRDSRTRLQGIVTELRKRGSVRPLAALPSNWQDRLDALEATFPNFRRFIDFLRCQFALSDMGTRDVAFPPVLLNGPPGIGKSEVLHRLASILGMPTPLAVDFATAQSSARLTGSDSHWANAQEGELFRTLALGTIGNPLVFIDEIEKADGEGRYNPQASLYGVLEATSARKFQDLSLRNFPINAAHVNWVAAANNAEVMTAPLRSRFVILEIPAPTTIELRGIHAELFEAFRMREVWGQHFQPLPQETLDALAGTSPREAKLLLRTGAGRAGFEGRDTVLPQDVLPFLPERRRSANFVCVA